MKRLASIILTLTMLLFTTLTLTACPKSAEIQGQQQYLPPQHQPRGGFRFITGSGEFWVIVGVCGVCLAVHSFSMFIRCKANKKTFCKIRAKKQ